jgi:hypothetical protein
VTLYVHRHTPAAPRDAVATVSPPVPALPDIVLSEKEKASVTVSGDRLDLDRPMTPAERKAKSRAIQREARVAAGASWSSERTFASAFNALSRVFRAGLF